MVKVNRNNFSEWYLKTILEAELIDYGPVKGTIILKSYAYRIWEKLQRIVDEEIKKLGVQNVYFPIFIPERFLKKEKEHFQGFTPEVAVVTYAGGEDLKEKLIVRPTSETIIYPYFANWVKSYRDLPILVNQWSNVIRWEKRPFPFVRNTEFLWQEGHTLHENHQQSSNFALKALEMYEKIYMDVLGIYGIKGEKSEAEKFAGALVTYTYEILFPDGKALQACTSHDLGQNFSKVFGISFQTKTGKLIYGWQTSWGLSTRVLGALCAVHGDERGLVFPPSVAPYEIIIIPIYKKTNQKKINYFIEEIKKELANYDIFVDNSGKTPGYKFNFWDLKGVPLRVEIGDQEIAAKKLTIFRRDNQERFTLSLTDFKNNLENIFKEIKLNLLEKSKKFVLENTFEVKTYEEFKKIMATKRGFIKAPWCENKNCEFKIKEETKATTRCLPFDKISSSRYKIKNKKCIYCRQRAKNIWYFAQSY